MVAKRLQWTLDYLEALHRAAKVEASRRGIRITRDDLAYMSSSVPDLILNFDRQEVLLAPADPAGAVALIHRRARKRIHRSTRSIGRAHIKAFQEPAQEVVPLLFHPNLHKVEDTKGLQLRARFYLNTFEAEWAFNRNLQRISDLMLAHKAIGSAMLREEFAGTPRTTLMEAACILLVTGLENFLRDAFVAYSHLWFAHLEKEESRNRAALEASRNLNLYGAVTDKVMASPERKTPVQALREELDDALEAISFQGLAGPRSATWAFKSFLGLDMQELPTMKKAMPHYWNAVTAMVKRRHGLVHSKVEVHLPRKRLADDVGLLFLLEKNIMATLMERDAKWSM